ncbi:MAG: GSU2403 family nucleotidyltransferase fold protein, partial [Actinomycetota bacterium]
MDYIHLSDNAARQLIDASSIFEEWRRVAAQAKPLTGGMYWKRRGDYEYLVRTQPSGAQSRIGARGPETQAAYAAFTTRKAEFEVRLSSLRFALIEAERQNKALKVGRAPTIVIEILNVMDAAGLARHFTVVGTHALYAYEAAAGVRFSAGALATNDVDLLWDARSRVKFVSDMARHDGSMLRLLQRVDHSFIRAEGHPETAINARGFKVDFLKREPEAGDPHPFSFSGAEDELSPVQARRAAVLTNASRFSHVV